MFIQLTQLIKMISFKAVISSLFILLLINCCQCNLTATLGTLQQAGPCNSSIFSLGSLAVIPDPTNASSIGGTFEIRTNLDSKYRAGLSIHQKTANNDMLVSARSGILCSALGTFPWLLHDVKIEPAGVQGCPVPAGKYTVQGFHFDNERFKHFDKGSYEIRMELLHEDQLVCAVKVDLKLA